MSTPTRPRRLLSRDVVAEPVSPDGGSEALATAGTTLHEVAGAQIGIWEAGPGQDVDVEADEVFVVLAGAGTVTFEDGSVLELRPGVAARLRAGDRTTWDVTERVRKLYVIDTNHANQD